MFEQRYLHQICSHTSWALGKERGAERSTYYLLLSWIRWWGRPLDRPRKPKHVVRQIWERLAGLPLPPPEEFWIPDLPVRQEAAREAGETSLTPRPSAPVPLKAVSFPLCSSPRISTTTPLVTSASSASSSWRHHSHWAHLWQG